MWKINIKCQYCKNQFESTELDLNYGDLRDPIFFVPDNHYFLICPECGYTLIQSNIPADVALRVQRRIHESTTED